MKIFPVVVSDRLTYAQLAYLFAAAMKGEFFLYRRPRASSSVSERRYLGEEHSRASELYAAPGAGSFGFPELSL
jgi:hypothetical protein